MNLSIQEENEVKDFLRSVFTQEMISDIEYTGCWTRSGSEADKFEKALNTIKDKTGAVWARSGATKCVFYYDDFPGIVVKVPIKGEKTYHNDIGKYAFEDYKYATYKTDLDDEWDYCRREAFIYKNDIVGSDFEDMFTETRFLCDIHGYPFYISEYVEGLAEILKCSDNSAKKANEIMESYDWEDKFYIDFSYNTIGILLETYGQETTLDFFSFIKYAEISDMGNNDNYTFTKDGNIIIFDYAGYLE